MKEINQEIERLQQLMKQEKEADLDSYLAVMSETSYADQRKRGVCWYPVIVDSTKFDGGDRLLIKINRPKEHIEQHQFQSGKLIRLFSNYNNEEEAITGVVNYAREHEMMITLNADNFPEWLSMGKLGVQLLFDENSYKEMEYALKKLLTTVEDRHIRLKEILLGNKTAQFEETNIISNPFLNQSQNDALNNALNAKDIAIIHGPPGTGKTTTLIQTIIYSLKKEEQVLVCAPSNTAVDLLTEKLVNEGINVVRIGHPARVTEQNLNVTLDSKIAHHEYYKELKAIRKQTDELHRMAHKYKRNFGAAERQQRRELFTEARRLKDEADQLSYYISNDVVSKAQVITSTLVGASNSAIRNKIFNVCYIDEAAQALEAATWIPILKSHKVIFAGDHFQLPPTIKSFEAAKNGLAETLFEKAIKRNSVDIMLKEQYRMNSQIMNFSNSEFYKGDLIANDKVANHKIFQSDSPVEFIDTAGTGYFEEKDSESLSTFNKDEANLVLKHFEEYLMQIDLNETNDLTAAIIAPYKAQVGLLQDIFADIIAQYRTQIKIEVNTIDSFQGQEKDIIYISLTRSNENSEIGFLSDQRRMNVALTRARKKLVVFGDSATIGAFPFYDRFINYATNINAYRSAFELM